jgi:hypothetical protein
MVMEEIYILTKHAKYEASYIENLPIYKRRYILHLLEKENEEIEKLQDQAIRKSNNRPRR